MKMFLISDNDDTLTGMRLSGVEGDLAHSKEDTKKLLDRVMANSEYAIIVVTEKISQLASDEIKEIRLNKKLPLIVVIPDRHGSQRDKDFITRYVREAIGINV